MSGFYMRDIHHSSRGKARSYPLEMIQEAEQTVRTEDALRAHKRWTAERVAKVDRLERDGLLDHETAEHLREIAGDIVHESLEEFGRAVRKAEKGRNG